jgi:hypothetical protein
MRSTARPPAHAVPGPRPAARAGVVALAVGLLAAQGALAASQSSTPGSTKPVYKWVDEKGVPHYGDAVPPQYADQDKTLMNSQGVPVGAIPGRRTPEQLEAQARQHALEEKARQDQVLARQRDQNLLATYLSVDEIESLRDRRLEILEAQAKVTSQYLDTLRSRLKNYEAQTQRFAPYSSAAGAQPVPEHLAEDLVRTVNEIRAQERNLELKHQESQRLQEQFGRDIARFKELKKIEAEYARSAQPRS